jgi:SAM-dependent methyltransferase
MDTREMTPGRAPRSRFYDGGLYAVLMDPLTSRLRDYIVDQVPPGQRIVEAACGTGRLAFQLAQQAQEVVGVELSPAMFRLAQRRLDARPVANLSFVLGDVTTALADRPEHSFDLATLVLSLHEMPAGARIPVLTELGRVAREVMCIDYSVPMPRNLAGTRNRVLEVAAGVEHFRAFLDFGRKGGAAGIAAAAGLHCDHVRALDSGTLSIHRIWAS